MVHIMDTRAMIPHGWECPKCRAVYAPWMLSCLTCQPSMLRLADPFGLPPIQPVPVDEPAPRPYDCDAVYIRARADATPNEIADTQERLNEAVGGLAISRFVVTP